MSSFKRVKRIIDGCHILHFIGTALWLPVCGLST